MQTATKPGAISQQDLATEMDITSPANCQNLGANISVEQRDQPKAVCLAREYIYQIEKGINVREGKKTV